MARSLSSPYPDRTRKFATTSMFGAGFIIVVATTAVGAAEIGGSAVSGAARIRVS